MNHICVNCQQPATANVKFLQPPGSGDYNVCMSCAQLAVSTLFQITPLQTATPTPDALIQTIDRLCAVIETSIAEGSTIVSCPAAVEARGLIGPRATTPTFGFIPAKAEV